MKVHYHVAHYEEGKLTDICELCGFDIRDKIHISTPTAEARG